MDLKRSRRRRALASAVLCLACGAGAADAGASDDASQAEVVGAIEAGRAPLLLDVRTPQEFASGHLPGALNIPIDQLAARTGEIASQREREVVVYCESGRRAARAADALASAGFTRVRHLDGDMAAWRSAGLPVE